MTPEAFGWLTRLHGHLAVLGLAVLMHPIVTLRRRPGLPLWTRRTAELGALLLAIPFAMGWLLYPTYRGMVKPALWQRGDPALWRFESKEHLAALCVALAVGGALTLRFAGTEADARRTAWWLLLGAWICGALTAALGIFVAGVAQPGW
ncbi:MAG: hypothetical protein H6733_15985 [Alphaproteobacteria bacterium]|nr:hypothetical protein [Alphaproteobacteria bacterium]